MIWLNRSMFLLGLASEPFLQASVDVAQVRRAWEAALAAGAWAGQPVWLHGDLHPANLLVADHELSAVIDLGLLGVGDPACDLMVAWTYLSADSRAAFRSAVAVDDATWSRGRGWALLFGLRAAAYSADNPVLADIGWRTLAAVLPDFTQSRSQIGATLAGPASLIDPSPQRMRPHDRAVDCPLTSQAGLVLMDTAAASARAAKSAVEDL